MAYIKFKNYYRYKIGERKKTTVIHETFEGYFEIGTEVTVIAIGERGYDIKDDEGNIIREVGWKI